MNVIARINMQLTFIETSIFSRDRSKYFDDDEFNRFESALLENPEVGDVITGTGGCRKVRWKRQGTGKSGGVRVIYYHLNANHRLYLLLVYPKNQQDNLTDAQKNALYNIIKGLG
jgi:hypothetical protein